MQHFGMESTRHQLLARPISRTAPHKLLRRAVTGMSTGDTCVCQTKPRSTAAGPQPASPKGEPPPPSALASCHAACRQECGDQDMSGRCHPASQQVPAAMGVGCRHPARQQVLAAMGVGCRHPARQQVLAAMVVGCRHPARQQVLAAMSRECPYFRKISRVVRVHARLRSAGETEYICRGSCYEFSPCSAFGEQSADTS